MGCHESPAPGPPPAVGTRDRCARPPDARRGPDPASARTPTVLLLGNPNAGKSTLFNRLTGARQRVVNAPGTTVEIQTGRWRDAGADLVDLPGTYSLLARSPDEAVAADAVLGRDGRPSDLVVLALDATAPSRSLYLLAQVAEAGRAVVVAVTFGDVAGAQGAPLDPDALARVIGVPVVAVDPRTGDGAAALAAAVREALVTRPLVRGLRPGPRSPGPASSARLPGSSGSMDDLVQHADELLAWVARVAAAACPAPATPRRTRSDRVDAVLLRPWVGIPVFLAVMWALFQLSTAVAAPVMVLAADLVAGPVAAAVAAVLAALGVGGGWLEGLLVDGVLAGVGTVAAFAPLMMVMFLAMALLEDSGYLARAAFVADRGMRALGLDGRALLPLVVGFGCNLPALAALRTLPDARQRLLTGLLVPVTSCSARLTVYVLLATAFFPRHAGTVIFGLYVTSVALVVLGGLALRRTAFQDLRTEPLLLVLPPYQRPRLGALTVSAWHRVRAFAVAAGRVIVVTLTVVWGLMAVPVSGGHAIGDVPVEDSLFGAVAESLAPAFAPAGFGDWHASAALMTGFVAKEVVVGSLAQTYALDAADDGTGERLAAGLRETFTSTSGGHPAAAALAFMVFVLAYTPCLATLAEQRRLFGPRPVALAVATQLAVAWLLAVAVFQVGRLL
jgi:ferrous iron transport protein B